MKLIINDDVYQKIMYLVGISSIECSGLGKVVQEDGNLRVVSACLLKQENTGATTDIDPGAVTKAMYELRDSPGTLNFWWHSHVNMTAFWSGTDKDTIKEIGVNGFCIATVFNKKAESRTAYFQGSNGGIPAIFLDEIETEVDRRLPKELCEEWKADFEAKCKPKYARPLPSPARSWNPVTEKWGDYVETDDLGYDNYDYYERWKALQDSPAPIRQDNVQGRHRGYNPPLWDYRKVEPKGTVIDVIQLEKAIRLETLRELDELRGQIDLSTEEREVKRHLVRICQICNQIERHLTEPMEVPKDLKKFYKQEFMDLANAQIDAINKKEAQDAINDATANTH